MAYAKLLDNSHKQDQDPWRQKSKARDSRQQDTGPVTEKRTSFEKSVVKAHEEPGLSPRRTKREPTNALERYLNTIIPVERIDARFVINYEDGTPLLTFSGDVVYMKNKNDALSIVSSLSTFGLALKVCYGPIGSKGRTGQPI